MGWGQAVATPSFWTLGLLPRLKTFKSCCLPLDWIGTSTRVPCVCVCVCVSHPLFQRVFLLLEESYIRAGGNGPFMSPSPTKLLMNWEDITTDHRDVPASVPSDSWSSTTVFGFLSVFSMLTSCLLQSTMSHVELINWVLFMLSHLILLFTALAIGKFPN